MKIRPKLAGAPLGYTLNQVEGTGEAYGRFGKALWSEDSTLDAVVKELVFLRTSLVNHCHT